MWHVRGEYYFTKDLILHLRYCDWPLDSTMRYNSTLVTRKKFLLRKPQSDREKMVTESDYPRESCKQKMRGK